MTKIACWFSSLYSHKPFFLAIRIDQVAWHSDLSSQDLRFLHSQADALLLYLSDSSDCGDAIYDDEDPAASAMAAALADARFLRSPCLPFCCDHQQSVASCLFPHPSLPPTWRIAGPSLHGARQRVSCRPSSFGARRGRRRRGSGCTCSARFHRQSRWAPL